VLCGAMSAMSLLARCTMVHEAVGLATALRAVSPDAEATAT
jgi:hypothetical protein